MTHNHHNHSHHNLNQNISDGKRFKIGIAINLLFVLVELIVGILADSLALIADAGHNLGDVFGLLIAWGASILMVKKPSGKFTYGFKKSSILAAQLNSLILLAAVGIIIWEAINRLSSATQVDGGVLMIVAGIGVVINGITTYLFIKGKDTDLNIKGAYLHMLADTMISFGVVLSGFLIILTGFNWIDPIVSIIIAIIIFWSTWRLFQDATKLSLDAVPDSINIDQVKKYFSDNNSIVDFHDLHVWALSTTETALTVHLVIDELLDNDSILQNVNDDLKSNFSISHSTIQIEQKNCTNGC
jgi:cobalt-zinc-cadmium efflux system protein